MAAALLLRLLFASGPLGSDDVTYLRVATDIVAGNWAVTDYAGATRYGINLPVAATLWVFGKHEIVPILWPLFCSLAEIALIVLFTSRYFSTRAGIMSGLLLVFLPLHVNLAGRVMADAPLALCITSAFLAFIHGEQKGTPTWFWLAGFALGAVFWMKESVLAVSLVFLAYPIVFRRWNWQWLYMVAGALVMVLGNLLFFHVIAGNALHIVDVVSGIVERRTGVAVDTKVRDIGFYLRYLFVDVRHTLFLGYFAVFGAVWLLRKRGNTAEPDRRPPPIPAMILLWGGGLWVFLTFFVVSIDPIRLIAKQTNYMLIFVAPMAILGGYFLCRISGRSAALLMLPYAVGGILLAGLQQLAVQNFTANSKATLAFARDNPGATVYAGTNALSTASYYQSLSPSGSGLGANLRRLGDARCSDPLDGGEGNFLVIDEETRNWGRFAADIPLTESRLQGCLEKTTILSPIDYGTGRWLALFIGRATTPIPGLGPKIKAKIDSYATPQPATLYRILPANRDHSP